MNFPALFAGAVPQSNCCPWYRRPSCQRQSWAKSSGHARPATPRNCWTSDESWVAKLWAGATVLLLSIHHESIYDSWNIMNLCIYIYIYYRCFFLYIIFLYLYNIYISLYRHYFLTYTVYCNYIQLSYVKDLQDLSGAGSARNLHRVELGTHQQKMYVFCRSPPKKTWFSDSRTTCFSISREQHILLSIHIYMYTLDVFGDLLIKPKLFQQKANKNDLLDQMSSISERI